MSVTLELPKYIHFNWLLCCFIAKDFLSSLSLHFLWHEIKWYIYNSDQAFLPYQKYSMQDILSYELNIETIFSIFQSLLLLCSSNGFPQDAAVVDGGDPLCFVSMVTKVIDRQRALFRSCVQDVASLIVSNLNQRIWRER